MRNIEKIIFDLVAVILNIDYNLTRKVFQDFVSTHRDDLSRSTFQ